MEAQINDTESDLSDVSILQTEDWDTSDIRINYCSDVCNVGTIIYDQNLRNDGDNQTNPPWEKDLSTFSYYFYILYGLLYNIIIIILILIASCSEYYLNYQTYFISIYKWNA